MFFLLVTPEYNSIQSNITKVRVSLKNGIAEIFDQHQDLMGRVDNNIIEIESLSENKVERSTFVLQDAVFIVSNQGLDKNAETKSTTVYVYAKNGREISSLLAIDSLQAEYEKKNAEWVTETQKAEQEAAGGAKKVLTAKNLLLKDEVAFLKKVLVVAKQRK
jgi:F0F1-type ATP synthase epsilon subunit